MAEKATASAQPDLRGLAERLDKATIRSSGFCTQKPDCPYCEVRRLINELLAALAVPEDGARSAWRPIESAPKDGRWVIGWAESTGGMIQMRWNQDFGWWDDVDGFAVQSPSHWMRPAPPVAAARPSGEQEGQ